MKRDRNCDAPLENTSRFPLQPCVHANTPPVPVPGPPWGPSVNTQEPPGVINVGGTTRRVLVRVVPMRYSLASTSSALLAATLGPPPTAPQSVTSAPDSSRPRCTPPPPTHTPSSPTRRPPPPAAPALACARTAGRVTSAALRAQSLDVAITTRHVQPRGITGHWVAAG